MKINMDRLEHALLGGTMSNEDIAFIVRAVNSHEEMLAALKDSHPDECLDGWAHCQCEHAKLIRRAEGK